MYLYHIRTIEARNSIFEFRLKHDANTSTIWGKGEQKELPIDAFPQSFSHFLFFSGFLIATT